MSERVELQKRLLSCLKLADCLKSCVEELEAVYVFLLDEQMDAIIHEEILAKFWNFFPKSIDPDSADAYLPLIEAVDFLFTTCKIVNENFDTIQSYDLKSRFNQNLHTQIISHVPSHLHQFIVATYSQAFKAFLSLEQKIRLKQLDYEDYGYPDSDNDISIGCVCCNWSNHKNGKLICDKVYSSFWYMNNQLKRLNLLSPLIGDVIIDVVRGFTETKISIKCKSNFSVSFLNSLHDWVDDTVKKWIIEVYGLSKEDTEAVSKRLTQFINDTYADVRVSQLFDIILDYPDSRGAILDLKICLDKSTSSSFRLNLIDSIKKSLETSLLHPGVNTLDILTAYISSIKALRALDPTGLILQLVTEPIRKYLKSRDDTVRCIVTTLTDDNHAELNKEMISTGTANHQGQEFKASTEVTSFAESEQVTATNWSEWRPDPIDLSSIDEPIKSNRYSDIVSILVNIYETKDRFVEEYQKLLSQRLLHKYDDCNLEIELRNLELLTMRFSDCELHRCEVMLKDVQASKRIHKRILDDEIEAHKLEQFRDINALIVSSPFWPEKFGPLISLGEDPPKIEFPQDIEKAIKCYTKAFETIRANRTLHWRHHLGLVDMDLIFGQGENERVVNFKVSPLHASLIYLFQKKKSWKLNELMIETSLSAAILKSRLSLWIRNGIIKDTKNDHFELIQGAE